MFGFDFYWHLFFMIALGAICFYIGHRGLSGVITDVENLKTDVAGLKANATTTTAASTPAS